MVSNRYNIIAIDFVKSDSSGDLIPYIKMSVRLSIMMVASSYSKYTLYNDN